MSNINALELEKIYLSSTSSNQVNFWQILRFLKTFVMMTISEEKDSLEQVGKFAEVLSTMPAQEFATNALKQDPDCAKLIKERYIPADYDLDYLLTLEPDSLGYQFAQSMREKNFDPNLHRGLTAETDGKYVELRLSQTHDIWHVITGFDVSEIDEIGLQAFHLTQFPYPFAIGVLASSFIASIIWEPRAIPTMIDAIVKGLVMGKVAKQLFAQKWEEGWDKPLVQWQKELNIQPFHTT